jgi:hypothetical protein
VDSLQVTFIIAVLLAFVSVVGSITYYNVKETEMMTENIKAALEKGVDPMAVRCSYSKADDRICVVYAASPKKL